MPLRSRYQHCLSAPGQVLTSLYLILKGLSLHSYSLGCLSFLLMPPSLSHLASNSFWRSKEYLLCALRFHLNVCKIVKMIALQYALCVFVCTCVRIHMKARGQHQMSSTITLRLVFYDKIFPWTHSSSIQIDWLTNELQGSSRLCFPSTAAAGHALSWPTVLCFLGIPVQDMMLVQQVLYTSTHWAISPVLPYTFEVLPSSVIKTGHISQCLLMVCNEWEVFDLWQVLGPQQWQKATCFPLYPALLFFPLVHWPSHKYQSMPRKGMDQKMACNNISIIRFNSVTIRQRERVI